MTSEPKRITAHGEKLLDRLRQRPNEWFTRREVAFLIDKKRLTPYDIAMLDLLVERGYICHEKEEGYSREGYRWRYGYFTHDE